MSELRFLVLDAYPREGRVGLTAAGATLAGELYRRLLLRFEPRAIVDVLHPADADLVLPEGVALGDYDGVVWTGSSLTIHQGGDVRVLRQIEFARAVAAQQLPSFGSCWAAQLACTAFGGRCAPNPKGREFGLSRRIELTDAGRAHPMFAGKPAVFDALTSHADEVVELPDAGVLLASNAFSRVQAVAVDPGNAPFWAVQYHPEYDLHEVARLCVFRMEELVRQGMFADRAAGESFVRDLEALHADRGREDLILQLDVPESVLDDEIRTLEARNWIRTVVRPRSNR